LALLSEAVGKGSSIAELRLKIAQKQKDECSEELIQYLRTDMRDGKEGRPSPLDETIERFTRMVNDAAFKIPIACFYENRATQYSSVLSGISENIEHGIDADDHGITVPQDSACIDGAERIGLDVRHNMLHKHASPDGDGFVRIADRLKDFVKDADETMEKKKCRFILEDNPKSRNQVLTSILKRGINRNCP